ncbi:hypothetical protein DXB65_24180 [Bacteroides oleiciplenus]|uniref:Uncharacterized protein n=2 Tax=Bacteroides oleiciplenus TaxID=626931 RepID=A0A3E5AV09_9BACE|nr:hypothetical protein DXB65_24180 [Bacteroides oleiciplenus]
MDMSVRLAHSYFDMLKSLGSETKLHLIKMLTDSLLKNEGKDNVAKSETLESLFGVWADDSDTDKILETIKDKRSGTTRHIVSLD